MKVSVEKPGSPGDILEHFGIKGMKWGVRKAAKANIESRMGKSSARAGQKFARKTLPAARAVGRAGSAVSRAARGTGKAIVDAAFIVNARSDRTRWDIADKASTKLMNDLPRIKARHGEYGKLRNRIKKPFSKEARAYRKDVRETYTRHLENTANSMTSGTGRLRYTLKENGKPNTSAYFWDVSVEHVEHAAVGTIKVRPIFDDEGWIVDIKVIDDEMEQSIDLGIAFLAHIGVVEASDSSSDILEHFGVKGMKWGVRKAYVQRVKSQAARDRRVAEGTATRSERVKSALLTSGARKAQSAIKGKSVAELRAKSAEDHVRRMEAGKATTGDIIKYYGTVRYSDIIRGMRKEPGT